MTDFACNCGEEGKAKMTALMEEVTTRLLGDEPTPEQERFVTQNFISAIVYALEWDHNAHVTGIYSDQWCGIRAEQNVWNAEKKEFEETREVFVMCDLVEHGMALLWKKFADVADVADTGGGDEE